MAIAAFEIPPRIAGHLQHTVVSFFPPPHQLKFSQVLHTDFKSDRREAANKQEQTVLISTVNLSQEEVSPYLRSSH